MMKRNIVLAGNYDIQNSRILAIANALEEISVTAVIETSTDVINNYSLYNPTAVFVDVFMDDITGFEICRFIKEQNDGIETVVVSETFRPEFRRLANELGLDGYIYKTANDPLIRSVLRNRS